MKSFLKIAAVALLASVSATAANASTNFVGSYSTTSNQTDPGLVVNAGQNISVLDFTLNEGGSKFYNNLFSVYTNEGAINNDDYAVDAFQVTFNFTQPLPGFGGDATGGTSGFTTGVFGSVQGGKLVWDNGGVFNLYYGSGNSGILTVKLTDVVFNRGFLWGTSPGQKSGGNVDATFTLTQSAVPEPATWAMMITGFGLVGAAMRRRQRAVVTA
jgi:hypothetical protein